MGRDNFMVKLTDVEDKKPVFVMIHNILYIEESNQGSHIHMPGGAVVVTQTVEEIERMAGSYGVMKVVKQ